MNVLKLSVLAAIMVATGIVTVKSQTVDEIMDKHEKAIGGIDNWNKIKTMKAVGSMSSQGMEIALTQTVEFGKAMRMDISVMGMNGWQIVTTNGGWTYMPFMGAAKIDTMKPEMLQASQKQLDIRTHQMLDYKTNGSKLEYAGRDTINNAPCYKVKMTDKDGNESTSFFDCATYYLLRTESKVKQNDQEVEVAVLYGNYKPLDGGVVMPMTISPAGQGEITFKSIDLNKPVDEGAFVPQMPKPDATPAKQDTKPAAQDNKPDIKK